MSLSFSLSKIRDDTFDVKNVRPTHRHTFFLIINRIARLFYDALPLCHGNKSKFATHHRTDSYLLVIKTVRGAQTVNTVVGALVIFVGAQRTIVGARAPTMVYKLTPMMSVCTCVSGCLR